MAVKFKYANRVLSLIKIFKMFSINNSRTAEGSGVWGTGSGIFVMGGGALF